MGIHSATKCNLEGGEIVAHEIQNMVDSNGRLLHSADLSFEKVWRALTCRAHFAWNDEKTSYPEKMNFLAIRDSSSLPSQFIYDVDRITEEFYERQNDKNYVLCRYNRGFVWNMQKPFLEGDLGFSRGRGSIFKKKFEIFVDFF